MSPFTDNAPEHYIKHYLHSHGTRAGLQPVDNCGYLFRHLIHRESKDLAAEDYQEVSEFSQVNSDDNDKYQHLHHPLLANKGYE